MPRHKDDVVRAIKLAAMDYYILEPVIPEMFRWLRTFKSPIADVFIEFFTRNAFIAAEDVGKMLSISKQEHLKYTIVTQVLPEWPASALVVVKSPLSMLVTHSGAPETALMTLRLLAMRDLTDKEWLKNWLSFLTERMERNLTEARQIAELYF